MSNPCYHGQQQGHFPGPVEGDSQPFFISGLSLLHQPELALLVSSRTFCSLSSRALIWPGLPTPRVDLPIDCGQGQAVFRQKAAWHACPLERPAGPARRPAKSWKPAPFVLLWKEGCPQPLPWMLGSTQFSGSSCRQLSFECPMNPKLACFPRGKYTKPSRTLSTQPDVVTLKFCPKKLSVLSPQYTPQFGTFTAPLCHGEQRGTSRGSTGHTLILP